MNSIIQKIQNKFTKKNIPSFKVGDKLKIFLKVKEWNTDRIQIFEGDLIAKKGFGITENIRIRKISNGIGVEKTLPIYSPYIDKIEVLKIVKVRKEKFYYLRGKLGKSAKILEKKFLIQNKLFYTMKDKSNWFILFLMFYV